MKYTSDTHFSAVSEVEDFCKYVIMERDIMFHPEDRFDTSIGGLTAAEAAIWNRLLDESMAVCEANNTDIYDIIIPLTLSAGNAKLGDPSSIFGK